MAMFLHKVYVSASHAGVMRNKKEYLFILELFDNHLSQQLRKETTRVGLWGLLHAVPVFNRAHA